MVVVPAPAVRGVVEDCARKGVHGLVVISAGFAETGEEGRRAERELVAFARRNGMRIIGPNCLGVVNTAPEVRLDATFAPVQPVPGRVAFLSQSGGLGIELMSRAGELGIGISEFVSVGNKADVSGNDLLQHWETDPNTDVILLYLESFGNPRKFARIARRVARHKAILAVKSGRTQAGTRAASSHTAALATPDVAVEALFEQTGVIRVDTLEQLLDTASVLAHQPLPPGRRVAIVGNAGGPGILAADACAGAGLEVPELSAASQEALRRFVARDASVRNPVDLVAGATADQFEQALRVALADPGIDALLAIFVPPLVTRAADVAAAIARAAAGAGDKPVLACFLGRAGVPDVLRGDGTRRTIPSFAFPEAAAYALGRAAALADWRRRPVGTVPVLADTDADGARAAVASWLGGRGDGAVARRRPGRRARRPLRDPGRADAPRHRRRGGARRGPRGRLPGRAEGRRARPGAQDRRGWRRARHRGRRRAAAGVRPARARARRPARAASWCRRWPSRASRRSSASPRTRRSARSCCSASAASRPSCSATASCGSCR
ncbi:MAG: hypothetical protein KatS3mg009_1641 [Acidimicrobiia bacterium]|nr:MAG: hypothetical protein KatS3mg009_1641 [Acidimicrobiia bacterium]